VISFETMTFVPDNRAIQKLLHGRDGMVAKSIYARALRVQAAAKRQVGVRTGRLRRSIHIEMTYRPVTSAYIGSNVRYALLHHEGSRRHPIVAKPGRMLVFRSNGKRVYAKKVLHPGTRPNRYLTDNLLRAIR
jgi:hypothetical protein